MEKERAEDLQNTINEAAENINKLNTEIVSFSEAKNGLNEISNLLKDFINELRNSLSSTEKLKEEIVEIGKEETLIRFEKSTETIIHNNENMLEKLELGIDTHNKKVSEIIDIFNEMKNSNAQLLLSLDKTVSSSKKISIVIGIISLACAIIAIIISLGIIK